MTRALCLLLLAACHDAPKKEAPAPAPAPAPAAGVRLDPALLANGRVQTTRVERRAPKDAWLLPGEVVAAELGAADVTTLVAGRVASIEVKDGSPVTRGAVLAWIDAPEAVRAAAELLRAQGRSTQASHVLARQEELAKENATSQNALDDARTGQAVAQADLQAARTLVQSFGGGAGGTSARIAVRAPIDGLVAERFTSLGSPVVPERPLFHLVAPGQVYVLAKLPETAPIVPKPGDVASVWPREAVGSERKPCAGRVVSVLDVVDLEHQKKVRIAPDAVCTNLAAGRYVDASFGTSGGVVGLVVPRDAVIEVKGADTVFLQQPDGAFVPRVVRIGVRTESERVVDEGLAEGDVVVTTGTVLLKGEILRTELAE